MKTFFYYRDCMLYIISIYSSTFSFNFREKVTCNNDYKAFPIETEMSFNKPLPIVSKKSRKKRATYSRNLSRLTKDRINNIPHDCYWCCKPSRPIIRPETQIWSSQTTSRQLNALVQFQALIHVPPFKENIPFF